MNIVDDFKVKTNYNLREYLSNVKQFFKRDYYQIVDFFKGNIDKIDNDIIINYENLIYESNAVKAVINNYTHLFNSIDYWELIEFINDSIVKLQTVKKLPKYLRVSRSDFNYKIGYKHKYNLGNESLENVAKDVKQKKDWNNDWVEIALNNKLLEIDYNVIDNDEITLYQERFISNFVTSVFDVMSGKTVYGKDIDKTFKFEDDDLKTLNYEETLYQTVDILSKLVKGNIPEYPELGLPHNTYVGGNIGGFLFFSIKLDLQRTFSSDDLFINFTLKQVKIEEDKIFIKFEVETKLNTLIEAQSII